MPRSQGDTASTCTNVDEPKSSHAISLARHLISLYRNNDLTDISVTCAGENFDLHSPILSHGSGYFRNILTANDDGDNESPTISLNFIPPIQPDTFRIIVDSLYTGIVHDMDETNVTSILEGSYHLDVTHAMDACVDFMLRHLDMDNCLQYWLSARLCDNASVKKEAIGLIGRHLDQVSKTNAFLELPSNTVMEILSDDRLQVSSEVDVYEAAMSWLKYDDGDGDDNSRVGELSRMLDSIRLDLLPVKYLVNVVGKEDMIEENSTAMSKYSKALKSKLGGEKSSTTKARHNMIHGMRGGYEKFSKSMRLKAKESVKGEEERLDPKDALEADDDSAVDEDFLPEINQRSTIMIPQGPFFKCCAPHEQKDDEDAGSSGVKVTLDNLTNNVKGALSNLSKSLKKAEDNLLKADHDHVSKRKTGGFWLGVLPQSSSEDEREEGKDTDAQQKVKKVVEVEEDLSIASSIPTPMNDMDGLSLATETYEFTKSISQDPILKTGDTESDGDEGIIFA